MKPRTRKVVSLHQPMPPHQAGPSPSPAQPKFPAPTKASQISFPEKQPWLSSIYMAKFLYKFRCFDLYRYKLPLGSSCHLLWLADFHKIEILRTQPRSCPKNEARQKPVCLPRWLQYCNNTVDRRNPAPVDPVNKPSIYHGFIRSRWLFGISSIRCHEVPPSLRSQHVAAFQGVPTWFGLKGCKCHCIEKEENGWSKEVCLCEIAEGLLCMECCDCQQALTLAFRLCHQTSRNVHAFRHPPLLNIKFLLSKPHT